MAGLFNSMFGIVTSVQRDGVITISGLNGILFARDIGKLWKTSRIENYMLDKVTRNTVVFKAFFAPDIVYMLNILINSRRYGTNIRILKKARDSILKDTWMGQTVQQQESRFDYTALKEFTLDPLPYQAEFFKYYDEKVKVYGLKGALLNAAPGTGKTYMGLVLAWLLRAQKVIVVCPKPALHKVWENSLSGKDKLFKTAQPAWYSDGDKPYSGERVVVLHYEAIEKVFAFIDQLKSERTVVLLDESHNMNEMTSLRTQRFLDMCAMVGSEDVLLESGTPIKALGKEAIPLFKAIDPLFTNEVMEQFKKIYGADATKGLDILKERLGMVSFIVEKKESGVEKPELFDIKVSIPNSEQFTLKAISDVMRLFIQERAEHYTREKPAIEKFFYDTLDSYEKTLSSKEAQKAYQNYRKDLDTVIHLYKTGSLSEAKDEIIRCNKYETKTIMPTLDSSTARKFKEYRSVIKYVGLKIQGECLGRVLTRKRIDAHIALVSGIDFEAIINSTEKKTVVFTTSVDVAHAAFDRTSNMGYIPIGVFGETTSELTGSVTKFESDEKVNPLIATYASLSTAVPLIVADTMIMIDAPFRSYIQEQAIARISRLGSTTRARVFRTTLDTGNEPNISSRSLDILKWSQEQVEKITGIKSPIDNTSDTKKNKDFSIENFSLENYLDEVNKEPLFDIKANTPAVENW